MPNLVINPTIRRLCHTYPMIFGKKNGETGDQWKGEKCAGSMRQSFQRALTTCRAPLPPGKKYVAVQFLSKETIFYVVNAKGKAQEIFDEACKHLALLDPELFGLSFYQDGDYIFIDLNSKISKFAARSWKGNSNGIGGDGQPLLLLHMRVKYYVDCHLLISEKVARHHYYLQLRENIKSHNLPVSEERAFLLAAFALQADLGNYSEERHKDKYFEISNYFPPSIIAKIGEDFIIRNISSLHKDNSGLSRAEAQVGYIKEASDVTAPHNLHFYKMRRKKGKLWSYVWIGIGDSGIHIYEEIDGLKSLLSTFQWCDIAKLYFEKKKFEILSEGSPEYRRFSYFVDNEELAKNLFLICRMTHQFHMSNQSRVEELKKLELDGGKPYREAYIYTDIFDQAREERLNSLQKNKLISKTESYTINLNSVLSHHIEPNHKQVNLKISRNGWDKRQFKKGQLVSQHHSMETLPLVNGRKFSCDIKFRSQSIPCIPDPSLTPFSDTANIDNSCQLWSPANSDVPLSTPTSTLLSRGSKTSNTDSSCSSLSFSSNPKASDTSTSWVKCDSFEELPIRDPSPVHKVCISTFVDKHVRTASVYDAVVLPRSKPLVKYRSPISFSQMNLASNPKIVDVKRSPSFNVCPADRKLSVKPEVVSKPIRQYVTNAQNHAHTSSHGKTRIGVSSLSRDQRLPLKLFNDGRILGCGSEPNLYVPVDKDDSNNSDSVFALQRTPNSRSELNLNVIQNVQEQNGILSNGSQCDVRNHQFCLPDEGLEGDFPCIPPPPAYRNDATRSVDSPQGQIYVPLPIVNNNSAQQSNHLTSSSVAQFSTKCKELKPSSSSPDVLDLHQLRMKSRDLDLPLISALCNDRSLLKLPKTVPTCSRERHLGSKDPLRFNRTTSLPNGEGVDPLLVNNGRPISWHVDSTQVSHWSDVARPCSASWDNSVKSYHPLSGLIRSHVISQSGDVGRPRSHTVTAGVKTHVPLAASLRSVTVPLLPPTILTSFCKVPMKQVQTTHSSSGSCDSYRSETNQMIPTKLMAGLSCIPNGRLYNKGSSS